MDELEWGGQPLCEDRYGLFAEDVRDRHLGPLAALDQPCQKGQTTPLHTVQCEHRHLGADLFHRWTSEIDPQAWQADEDDGEDGTPLLDHFHESFEADERP